MQSGAERRGAVVVVGGAQRGVQQALVQRAARAGAGARARRLRRARRQRAAAAPRRVRAHAPPRL